MRVDSGPWWDHARDLALAATSGDGHAAGELAGHVRPWVFRLAGRQFPYHGDAEDVTQQVCITVMRSVERLREVSRLRSWLASITLNEVRGFYRSQRHEAERLRRAVAASPTDGVAPARTSVLGGLRVDLLEGLDQLPRHQAVALGLRQLGLGYDEIAAELSAPDRLAELLPARSESVPVGSVRRWVSEARTKLSESIG